MPPRAQPRTERQREREREALDELRKDFRYATQRLYSPFTTGCSHTFPVADFTDAHYIQEDTSLNKTLWDLWPVTPPDGYKKVLAHHEAKRDELTFDGEKDPIEPGWFDRSRLPAALPHAERCRIAGMVRLMQELHLRLNSAGWLRFDTLADGVSPLSLLYTRQVMLDVAPLGKAVDAATKIKKEGDILIAKAHELLKEDHDFKNREILALFGAGIGKLCGALFSLWPWTASGLVMSPETAFGSGIAQLESQLWLDISYACFFLSGHAKRRSATLSDGTRYEDTEGYYFVILGRLANFVPINTRYVSFGVLQQALHHVAVFPLMFESLQEIWAGELIEAMILSERCGISAGLMPDAWAHANCDASHKRCMGAGYSKEVRKLAVGGIMKLKNEREARREQLIQEMRQEENSLEEVSNNASDGDDKDKEEGEWTFDKRGKKTFGPKVEYDFGGSVCPL